VTAALLRDDGTGTASRITALVGPAGSGTTSLALLACHDARVRHRFGGGVLWLTVGRERAPAEVAALLYGMFREAARARPPGCRGLLPPLPVDRPPADAGPLARHLADQLLGHGPMLLVADDVATPAQLEPLEVLARQMWLLVTTSDPGLPPPGHRRVEVGALDEAAAREVLTRGLPPIDPALRARLAAATGRLPLALALSNARLAADVARGTAVDAAARRAADRLERAGPYRPGGAGSRSGILAAAIGLAAEALPPELRDRFAELGVFPADAEIPVEAAHLLWSATAGLGRDQAERVCRTLAGLALVTLRDADPDRPALVVHDAVRDRLRADLGARRAEVNRLLADRYRRRWHQPEARFVRDHLAFHLAEAGRTAELTELVTDVRWMLARLADSGPPALEADLARSPGPRAAAALRHLRRVGHLLGDLDARGPTESNRLAHLAALPEVRAAAERAPLILRWRRPEPPPARAVAAHAAPVWGVAIAPDGSRLVTVAADRTVRIRRADGRLVAVLTGHTAAVAAVAFAPHGTWFATGSDDATARLWRADGHPIGTLRGHTCPVNAVAVAPDGSWLATGSDDHTVRIWRPDGTPVATLTGHTGPVYGVAIAPDGSRLATASGDATARLWRADVRPIGTLDGHADRVTAVAFAPDGTWLATASADATVRTWRPDGHPIAAHRTPAPVNALAVAPDGGRLAIASADHTVRIRRPGGAPLATLEGHTGEVYAVAFAPDGTWLATASEDETVRIWQAAPYDADGHTEPITAMAAAPDGTWLATGSDDATVRLWRADGDPVATAHDHSGPVNAVAVAPDGAWLATASDDHTVRIRRPDGTPVATLTGHTGPVYGVAIAPDATWLATASADHTVRIWRPEGEPMATLTGHTDAVVRVAIAPDCGWLATVSRDRTVRLWRADGEPIAAVGHPGAASAIAIAPHGGWLAAAFPDGSLRLLRPDGRPIATVAAHPRRVNALAVAPDAAWLATASDDRTVRIWRPDGTPVATLTGHTGGVTAAAVTPDGSRLVTASADGTLRVWRAAAWPECAAAVRLDGPLDALAVSAPLVIACGDATLYAFDLPAS